MEIVIKIPDEVYERAKEFATDEHVKNYIDVYELIRDGTVLPKKHGRLIDGNAVFTEWDIDYAPTLVDPTPDFL